MSCDNLDNYVDTINNICGQDVIFVMDTCNTYCLLTLVHLLDNCLPFLTDYNLDKELENIVEFCYNKNYPKNITQGHRRLTQMTDFNINELMLFIVGVLGALGGLCVIVQRSKCESFCWGCMRRDVDAVVANERLKITGHSGDTPRLEKEPEVENP